MKNPVGVPKKKSQGKHPTASLYELCQKKKWEPPKFTEEKGPRGFRFKVMVEGHVFQPNGYNSKRKEAKKDCSREALRTLMK